MLGKLGKWLRLLGLDCADVVSADDRANLAHARREERILLTRDSKLIHELATPADRCWLLVTGDWIEQLREVVAVFRLAPHVRLFTRCCLCNTPLEPADPAAAQAAIPAGSLAHGSHFSRCPRCGKFYWRGDHTRNMTARLAALAFPMVNPYNECPRE